MRFDYLEKERPILFNRLLLSDELYGQLADIDQAANNRIRQIVTALAKAEGVDEAMKAANQMQWVGLMNNFHACAEEIVLQELVYA